LHVADALLEPAPWNISPCQRAHSRLLCLLSLHRHAVSKPVGLAGRVVVDLGKAERFEPPRGSWTDVSLEVVAVDDHRSIFAQLGRRLCAQLLQRDADGSR